MRITSLTIALILIANFLQAQLNTSELNAYQNPDYKRTFLTSYFSGGVNGEKNYGTSIDTRLSHVRFKRNFQQDINFYGGIDISKKAFLYSAFLNYDQRSYFFKNFYISSDLLLNVYKNDYDDIDTQHQTYVRPALGLGYGRMEDITRPWLANNISKLLHKHYGISELSADVIFRLADLIVQAQNQRKLDFREENIKETNMVLNEIKIIYPEVEFTLEQIIRLMDIYRYEAPRSRQTGFRSSLTYSPTYSENSYRDDNNNYHYSYWAHSPELTSNYSRALSLDFQLDISALLQYNKHITSNLEDYLYTLIRTSLSYIPNARNITTLSSSYYKIRTQNSFLMELNYNYYISPSLRFSIRSKYNFLKLSDQNRGIYLDKEDRILASLQYIIF